MLALQEQGFQPGNRILFSMLPVHAAQALGSWAGEAAGVGEMKRLHRTEQLCRKHVLDSRGVMSRTAKRDARRLRRREWKRHGEDAPTRAVYFGYTD